MTGQPPPSATVRTVVNPRRGRHGRRRPLWIIALAAALAGVLTAGAVLYLTGDDTAIDDRPVGAIAGGLPADWAAWGFTHTETSADQNQGAQTAISRVPMLQNQHIMGFGALNPQETRGRFDWTSLDRRVDLMRRTNARPVLTLCCAPDWMKGGTDGKTDWGAHFEDAPLPDFFDAFAEQAAVVAKRYPDIKYFLVWNEFKGFYNQRENRWDSEGYTRLYNKVYAALKNVNPQIKVGGPYLAVNHFAGGNSQASDEIKGPWGSIDKRAISTLKYWIKNKTGADFIAIDGTSRSEDRDVFPDEFTALGKFSALTRWLRAKSGLPVVWPEWYVEPENSGWSADRLNAVQASAMIEFAKSGASGALLWSQQPRQGGCQGCLWDTAGQAQPALVLQQNFAQFFPPGTALMEMAPSNQVVRTLASKQKLLVVNTSNAAAQSDVGGVRLDLKPYEVRWSDR